MPTNSWRERLERALYFDPKKYLTDGSVWEELNDAEKADCIEAANLVNGETISKLTGLAELLERVEAALIRISRCSGAASDSRLFAEKALAALVAYREETK